MSGFITVAFDLAEKVFQAHEADASGQVVLRKKLRRDWAHGFFARLRSCVVTLASLWWRVFLRSQDQRIRP